MALAVETTMSRVSLPVPSHFTYAEQPFSLKKKRLPLSSSSTSNVSTSSPVQLSGSLPPLLPSKGCPPLSRVFPQHQSPWTPLSCSLSVSPPSDSVYDPSKQETYFNQCFTILGLLGRGCFGEVYKVQSNNDGRQYAVKRSAHRFRGNSERNRSVREAKNHERLCPHPHILNFVAAWEECGRLYIQTELCSTSLLLHAENQPPGPDECAAWSYLCDLLSALEHLHVHGFIHLDLKPANVLITASGRLKLADFGLLLELKGSHDFVEEKMKGDVQEGDPRYMAPELLNGEYGPAADVFSLGVSILELACNIEVPNGGEGWQQLRQGCLPAEFTSELSPELQTILQMMLAREPSERPTVSELLALPAVRRRRWKRRVYLWLAEAVLSLAAVCQSVVSFGCRVLSALRLPFPVHWTKPVPCTPPKGSCDQDLTLPLSAMHAESGSPEDDAVFWLDPEVSPTFSPRVKSRLGVKSTSTPLPASPAHTHQSPARSPSHSSPGGWSSCNRMPSRMSNGCRTLTPSRSELRAAWLNENCRPSSRTPSCESAQRRRCNWIRVEEVLPQPNLKPKNLLSLFEESILEAEP